ncbi:UvrD-helicase domain-containing protein [Chryseolinea sp. T2]|uniref:ATP-dependent helicase n=1 Tax=Chryseolinea sp. T2 TaxID=3129255 RepID=UPI0030780D43
MTSDTSETNSSRTDLSSLNERQREAVISADKRLLVLAGAGSGKTKTLLQKLVYLIEEQSVSPSNILAITFTKNAANEMLDRLIEMADQSGSYKETISNKALKLAERDRERQAYKKRYKWIDNLTVRTFHSFCYYVLRNYGVNEFDNKFRIIGDEKSDDEELARHIAPETAFEVFQKLLIECCADTGYLLNLKRYILDYVVDKIHIEKHSQRVAKDGKFFTTLNGIKVRSKSEQYIADWLYRHNLEFEYEPLLNISDFSFTPDFYIPAANLYIEHVSNKSYPMRDKEERFERGKLLLVKTNEYMTKDTALFNHALDMIVRGRVAPGKHSARATSYREQFNRYHEQVKDFVQQVMRVTDMIKVENLDVTEINERGLGDQHERVRGFYALAMPLAERYISYCIDKSYLDFNDLISRTISLFRNHEDIRDKFRSRFGYLLVDEFQDVNNLQVELIKMLLTDSAQLFCVGDDWQSIYGFRGSNVGYIIEFEKHFINASVIKLNLNYRSSQHIVGASNEVIKNNKFKVDKEIFASKQSEHKIVVFAGDDQEANLNFCVDRVRELHDQGFTSDDILFLYRRTKMYSPYLERFREEQLFVRARTIHAAKGLEAKVVFIIGLTEGYGGFPDIWLEDRIFQVIKKANHDQLLEEERRLFYVGITRAKDKLFLITEKGGESSFIKEIPESFTVRTTSVLPPVVDKVSLCPSCFSQLDSKLFSFCPYCGAKV